MNDRYVSAGEIIKRFKIKPATFYYFVKKGRIPYHTVERTYEWERQQYEFDPEEVARALGVPLPPP